MNQLVEFEKLAINSLMHNLQLDNELQVSASDIEEGKSFDQRLFDEDEGDMRHLGCV